MKLTLLNKLATGMAIIAAGALNLNAGTCTINVTANQQTIDGFGFSSAWCGQLSSAKNNALYGTLGMSLLRIRIDQNKNWSDETANASAAHAAGAKVLGCPWTAPGYMLVTNGSTSTLSSSHYKDYALYLGLAATNINLDYVSLKNEPNMSGEDFNLTSSQIETLMSSDAPYIGRPVAMADAFNFADSVTDPTLNNSTACSHVAIVSGHIYGGGNYAHTNALAKGKHVWMTEHYINGGQTSMSACVSIAKEISDCMNNRMSAYFWWWVYDSNTSINLVSSSGTIYKNGYTIGQFAKWIRPGKARCSATYNPSSYIYVTAYHNNGIVIVAVNTGSSSVSQTFTLQNVSGLSSLNVHRTSSSENMAGVSSASVANNTFTYTLPAQSITTFHQF